MQCIACARSRKVKGGKEELVLETAIQFMPIGPTIRVLISSATAIMNTSLNQGYSRASAELRVLSAVLLRQGFTERPSRFNQK